jgi:UDP-3-O-[3-hydroxymyristoyl] glucosamine N-acyltransferase
LAPVISIQFNHEGTQRHKASSRNLPGKFSFNPGHLCESVAEMIHPTAIIHPKAKLDATVQVGPYAVIDAGVELGADCVVGPHVYLTG